MYSLEWSIQKVRSELRIKNNLFNNYMYMYTGKFKFHCLYKLSVTIIINEFSYIKTGTVYYKVYPSLINATLRINFCSTTSIFCS